MTRQAPTINSDYLWMTEIPSRNPTVKLHKTIGQAKQAVSVRKGYTHGLTAKRTNARHENGRWLCDSEVIKNESTYYQAHVFQLVGGEWKYREDLSFVPWETHVWVSKDPEVVEGYVKIGHYYHVSTWGSWVPK